MKRAEGGKFYVEPSGGTPQYAGGEGYHDVDVFGREEGHQVRESHF